MPVQVESSGFEAVTAVSIHLTAKGGLQLITRPLPCRSFREQSGKSFLIRTIYQLDYT
jgi:hypothetical protein